MSTGLHQRDWKVAPRDLPVWYTTTDQDGNQLMRTEFGFVLTSWRYVFGVNDYEPFAVTYIPGEQ